MEVTGPPDIVSVSDLFEAVGVEMPKPVPWGTEIDERQQVIYVSAVDVGNSNMRYLRCHAETNM